jgi:tetratricopeptide (TPR) repeat protein
MRAFRLAAAALCLLASGCYFSAFNPSWGEPYLVAFAAGERAYHAGRYEEAARSFGEAAGKAKRVKDRDEALFMIARCLERSSRFREAIAAYERILKESPDGPRAGRAAFDIADVEIDHGDAAVGWRKLEEAARKSPQHGVARLAIRRLVEHQQEQGGEAAVMAWLDANRAAFRGTDQEEVIAYETASSLARAGRKQEAHDAFLVIARRWRYPHGGFFTDALWEAAALDEDAGRFAEAIEHLREMLAVREKADTTGSYERPRYQSAQLRIAELYRDKLRDRAAARREFHHLYRDFKTSRLRDDALWAEALLAREDRDATAACDLASELVKELPESRYASCARLLCPTAPAGKKECAEYIRRSVEGDRGE